MKKYIKDNKIKLANQIVVKKNKKQIINPKESDIIEDGWTEYIVPEPTEEETLNIKKNDKKHDIEFYEDSLKGIIIDGEEVQVDTETMNKMTFRVMAESAMNKNKTSLWFNGKEYSIKVKDAMELLYNMQVYFGELFDVANNHKLNIENLENIDEIESYDYMNGYPEKINFEIK